MVGRALMSASSSKMMHCCSVWVDASNIDRRNVSVTISSVAMFRG